MTESKDYDYLFKLVLLGDAAVGKSSILCRFADDEFTDEHVQTTGVDFRFRSVVVNNKRVKLQIWDTAGQERYRTIARAYYRGADGVIMTYSVTNPETFDHVSEWLADVEKFSERNPVVILVGNKADLIDQRMVDTNAAEEFAQAHHMPFIETSAKTNTNVQAVFSILAQELMERRDKADGPIESDALDLERSGRKAGKCPCA